MAAPRRTANPALTSGNFTFVFSALTSYYYLLGAILLPLWGLLWLLARRRVRAGGPPSLGSAIGLGFHRAAILAPLAAAIAFVIWINSSLSNYPDGSIRSGEPLYYFVYTPAVVVSVMTVAWAWLGRVVRSRLTLTQRQGA